MVDDGKLVGKVRFLAAVSVLVLVFGAGLCIVVRVCGGKALAKMPFSIRHADGVTVIGAGDPKAWILNDERVTGMGLIGALGRELRDFMHRNPGFGPVAVTDEAAKVPAEVDMLVAAGDGAREYLKLSLLRRKEKKPDAAKRLVLLSPSIPTRLVPPSAAKRSDLLFLSGKLMKPLYLHDKETAPAWAKFVPGAALYVPGWLDVALKGGVP